MPDPELAAHKEYWSMELSEAYEALGSGMDGLSELEAQHRLEAYGRNELPQEAFSGLRVFLRQFNNPIFVILGAAAIIAGIFADVSQSVAIAIMIALSVTLGFLNEYRAEKTVQDLRRDVSVKAVVTRDGRVLDMDAALVVPGDVVSLYVGDIVPADMRILEAKELQLNESILTGESFPVEKTTAPLKLERATPQQLTNCLFMGTVVAHGTGKGLVIRTGKNTEFGSISKTLARPHPETEFQIGVRKYGNMLVTLTLFLATGIFVLNALVGHPVVDSLLFSLAIAIGLVPELMPAIVTITLSQGARKMADSRVVVKRLVSIEDFGNMDVLCTDKTGTLTEGNIVLDSYRSLDGLDDPKVLCHALLCNSAAVGERVVGNPMDSAVWKYALSNGESDCVKPYNILDTIPFDYERRMMSVAAEKDGDVLFITKGAPESVLARCTRQEVKGNEEPIDRALDSIKTRISEYSKAGYRVLAIAYRPIEKRASYSADDEKELVLQGFLSFTDPPKKDARQAIDKLMEMGVSSKILTGDNELVSVKICEDINVPVKKVVTGANMTRMSSNELRDAVEEATIFARITPEQKLEIIKALRANGHIVGFMGDGVNDAPALYESDVGISVDSAVDVSKDAADIVLLEKDLLVLSKGIEEGRKIFGNTIKYILMGTSSNFGNMFSAAFASVFLPFLPMLPMQILFMNLLYDISNFTLPTDNVDEEYIQRPKRWNIDFVRKYTLFFGPFSSLYDFLTYGIMLFIFAASPSLFQSGWFVESFWTEVLVIFVIRTRRIPFFTSRPGKWLTVLTIAAVAFGTIVPFTPLGGFLGFAPLPGEYWALMVLMVATYLLLVDAGKVFFYRICKF